MQVRVNLTPEEVKQAIKNFVNTQGMSLSVKSVEFENNGAAVAVCEKAEVRSSFNSYDR